MPILRRNADARGRLVGGGPAGNELLTTVAGLVLIPLLAVLGVTILRIHQLIWLHLFLGLLLLGPLTLKMTSTGYRFARYYLGTRSYVDKGPPVLALRALGPLVVVSTVVVFASGIVLMFDGPADRSTALLIHKASFFVWLGATALHVLGHLRELERFVRPARQNADLPGLRGGDGAVGRWIVLAGAIVAGAVLALVLIPHFSLWTAPGAFPHHGTH
jgi:hypothetical protein